MAELYSFLGKAPLGAADLIERYVNYHGRLSFGHRKLFVAKLNAALGHDPLLESDVFEADYALREAFLRKFASAETPAYFHKSAGTPAQNTILILPESANEWQDTQLLPTSVNRRMKLPTRPALHLHVCYGHNLFVSPAGYQYFSDDHQYYWPDFSSRSFSRSIVKYRTLQAEKNVVVVQDRFDGGNFAHFLYDAVPRILYALAVLGQKAREAVFLCGGDYSDYHAAILGRLCDIHGLNRAQFSFPAERMVWRIGAGVYFFSDQKIAPAHPLHMAHPRTVRSVRDLAASGQWSDNAPRKLFISRADAGSRRITNEELLSEKLRRDGFDIVQLARLSIQEQLRLLSSSDIIVAPHGMGLTNLLFNSRSPSIIELFHPSIGTDAYAFVAKSIGARYQCCAGTQRDSAKADYEIDVQHVLELFGN